MNTFYFTHIKLLFKKSMYIVFILFISDVYTLIWYFINIEGILFSLCPEKIKTWQEP